MAKRKYIHFEQGYNPTDLERAELKGPVKEIMVTSYKAHQKAGIVIQGKIEVEYSSSNNNYIIHYDKNGFHTEEHQFGMDGIHIKTFNEKKQWVDEKVYQNNVLQNHLVLTYNEKGAITSMVRNNGDGTLSYRTEDKYDETGKKLSGLVYHFRDGKEILYSNTVHTYNEKGFLMSIIQYKTDGSLEHSTIYKRNEQGLELEQTTLYTDEKMNKYGGRKITHIYNEHGDAIETNFYKHDGSLDNSYSQTYEYDETGKKIVPERKPYEEPPPPPGETEELENDIHGNWIKATSFHNKIPINIVYREIIYYGDADENTRVLVHPIINAPKEEIEDTSNETYEMEVEDAKWMVEAPNVTPDNFSLLRYYTHIYKEQPSLVTYTAQYVEAITLLKELKENMRAQEIHSYCNVSRSGYRPQYVRYTLKLQQYGYILHAMHLQANNADEFDVPDYIDNHDYLYFSQFQLLRPSEASGHRDEYFEEELGEYFDKCTLTKKPDQPVINLIETTQNGYTMVEHAVDDDFEIKDLDVNYGFGFEKFHNELMQRFNTSTKGLVLFHGTPGTGKTYYIRHLLRKMAERKKVVIYMPPNMVDHLTDPGFMTFLSGEVREWSEDGKFCVLLIEDAEPLLAKRQEGVRIQGVTNLLNMTDGLLNDMLNLQIICTFNVDLKKLDSALLREGRLIARKEFKALSVLDANLLAQRLGIKHHFTKRATLGQIYAKGKNKNTLIHDVESDRDASSAIDDL